MVIHVSIVTILLSLVWMEHNLCILFTQNMETLSYTDQQFIEKAGALVLELN